MRSLILRRLLRTKVGDFTPLSSSTTNEGKQFMWAGMKQQKKKMRFKQVEQFEQRMDSLVRRFQPAIVDKPEKSGGDHPTPSMCALCGESHPTTNCPSDGGPASKKDVSLLREETNANFAEVVGVMSDGFKVLSAKIEAQTKAFTGGNGMARSFEFFAERALRDEDPDCREREAQQNMGVRWEGKVLQVDLLWWDAKIIAEVTLSILDEEALLRKLEQISLSREAFAKNHRMCPVEEVKAYIVTSQLEESLEQRALMLANEKNVRLIYDIAGPALATTPL